MKCYIVDTFTDVIFKDNLAAVYILKDEEEIIKVVPEHEKKIRGRLLQITAKVH